MGPRGAAVVVNRRARNGRSAIGRHGVVFVDGIHEVPPGSTLLWTLYEDQGIFPNWVRSAREVLRRKDFAQLTHDELHDAKRFLAQMRWTITRRRSLRMRAASRGRRMDVRRSVREGISVKVETAAPFLFMAPNAYDVLELRDLGACH